VVCTQAVNNENKIHGLSGGGTLALCDGGTERK
jgi:hypothetical protein